MWHRLIVLSLVTLLLWPTTLWAQAAEQQPAQAAEALRTALFQAQLQIAHDRAGAQAQVEQALAHYAAPWSETLQQGDPVIAKQIQAGLAAAQAATQQGDANALAVARAQLWTALLQGAQQIVAAAMQADDLATAQQWLAVREFRHATRFSRPGADATLALTALRAGQISTEQAITAINADLLDTYQARMAEALHDLAAADQQGFASRRAEHAALAQGYFAILQPAYQTQRGAAAAAQAQAAFAKLTTAAQQGTALTNATAAVTTALEGFRAAPLTPDEQHRRAGQLLRFLSLVPVEYGRGVRDGVVTTELEIREAITFRAGAEAAFRDLETLLAAQDTNQTAAAADLLRQLDKQLSEAVAHSTVAEPSSVTETTDQLLTVLRTIMPAAWLQADSNADFDVIASALDQMEAAAREGEYALAESARLEAYAILESGPEAKLTAFAPQMITPIEDLFWYGQGEQKGLAYLIEQKAPDAVIGASRQALDLQLAEAQRLVSGDVAPMAVLSNAALIVFREGLEAVLILASLLASLRVGTRRHLRTPLWLGAGLALLASALTWVVARTALTALARYGERLEAVVSLIAVAVLLLILNWFFHEVYWTGWMASFHVQKHRLVQQSAGQFIGLLLLGFSSIYREGFETVLFLQALVLDAGNTIVLGGVAVGLAATAVIGWLVFGLQARLPHKKMLIATGVLIGAVLLMMVGNTVHVLQVIGWLPIHPIRWLTLPYWSGMWLGLYATWEGISFQVTAGTFVIGSYFLAEYMQKRKHAQAVARHAHGTT
ncbi:MAG: FTR1 family protein [Caldilineaceae bacterium]|nr:FTR1 family protein [Caldilineaceae bacterium]